MSFDLDDLGIEFLWTGEGLIDIVVAGGSALPGRRTPPAGKDGKPLHFRIVNLDEPTEVEMASGLWTNSTQTLARTNVHYPASGKVSFSAGDKLVSAVLGIEQAIALEGSGRSIREVDDFSPGGTYTVDPNDPEDQLLKVFGDPENADLLSAAMTVDLNPSSAAWGDRVGNAARVVVVKEDASPFTITVSGGENGTSTRTLRVPSEWVEAIRAPGTVGPGPHDERFIFGRAGLQGRTAQRQLLVSGASLVVPNLTDQAVLYDNTPVFRGLTTISSIAGLGGRLINDATADTTITSADKSQLQAINADGTLSGAGFLTDDFLIIRNTSSLIRTITGIDGATFNGGSSFQIAAGPDAWVSLFATADGGIFIARGDLHPLDMGVASLVGGRIGTVSQSASITESVVRGREVVLTGNITGLPIAQGFWCLLRASGGARTITLASGSLISQNGTTLTTPFSIPSNAKRGFYGDGTNGHLLGEP